MPYMLQTWMLIFARDKDGYHWLTGRVDDVINVRYLPVASPLPPLSFFFPFINKIKQIIITMINKLMNEQPKQDDFLSKPCNVQVICIVFSL